MQLGYMTYDEVNLDLAQKLAAESGVTVQQLHAKGECTDSLHAILYDLECFPFPDRQKVIVRLLKTPGTGPVAVHAYALDDITANKLKDADVLVFPRLEATVIEQLRKVYLEAPAVTATPMPEHESVLNLEMTTEGLLDDSDNQSSGLAALGTQ